MEHMIYEHGIPAEHVTRAPERIPVTITDDDGQQFEGYAVSWTQTMVQAEWEVNRWVTRTAWMDAHHVKRRAVNAHWEAFRVASRGRGKYG
ncbi:hypothetical protein ACT3TB_16380 [Micrococcaceae sp. AOP34-BR2-30]